ncbi:chorismate synthase [Sulfoacidibacillus thermotolerans]|uniref:Chorismate synthase n=1 Tax=Sulfoacidibacillus thermotolerans TaxID=1765684 RepID=A0A2U3D6Z4_SULT2|nr:chorismate synthase [Sulfoacidibacillus thermotolerans]PWI57054.1 chorismate synthase [Sulfoacidibacillus thermotolerans]
MLRYLTAGESHGPALIAIIEGLPAYLNVDIEKVNHELWRRQQGYGRGFRMKIESDQIEFLSGLRFGKTLGSPLAFRIANRDYKNWESRMSPTGNPPDELSIVTKPRPGHADLAATLKYDYSDIRDALERASARNTATLVAVGAIARQFLAVFGIHLFSHIVQIGRISTSADLLASLTMEQIAALAEQSPVRTADVEAEKQMIAVIDEAKEQGNTVGGIFEVIVTGVPVGLGSYVMPDRRLDGRLAGMLMSIQAIKGVEIGAGFAAARQLGSAVHDAIYYDEIRGFYRTTNGAGGIEGGISNGEPIVVRAAMKPIPTLYKPLPSVDLETKEPYLAAIERSDACAAPAAAVVGENAVAWVIAEAFLEKFGGDSIKEVQRNYENYLTQVKERS